MEPLNLPPELIAALERQAAAQGLTFAEFIRKSLQRLVQEARSNDPLFADKAVWNGDVPADLSLNHNRYLHGDPS
jgi:hypothetical protein